MWLLCEGVGHHFHRFPAPFLQTCPAREVCTLLKPYFLLASKVFLCSFLWQWNWENKSRKRKKKRKYLNQIYSIERNSVWDKKENRNAWDEFNRLSGAVYISFSSPCMSVTPIWPSVFLWLILQSFSIRKISEGIRFKTGWRKKKFIPNGKSDSSERHTKILKVPMKNPIKNPVNLSEETDKSFNLELLTVGFNKSVSGILYAFHTTHSKFLWWNVNFF